jgi:DNA-binding transcriptional LysR family regulator
MSRWRSLVTCGQTAAAVEGLGLIYQPYFMLADAIRSGLLTVIHLDRPSIDLGGIYAIYPSGGRLPAKVRVFIDYLARAFAGTPPGIGVRLV